MYLSKHALFYVRERYVKKCIIAQHSPVFFTIITSSTKGDAQPPYFMCYTAP